MKEEVKLRAGRFVVPATITYVDNRIEFKFPFNRRLMSEIKAMDGAKWHGYDEEHPRKIWSVKDSERNRFQLSYLKGNDPYLWYDQPLKPYVPTRGLYHHQIELARHGLTCRRVIWAAEMGTGKTLAAIEVMESSGFDNWWYIGPRSAIKAVQREFRKWDSRIIPPMMTYRRLVSLVKQDEIEMPPRGVIFDESSRIKNPTSQRSEAANYLATRVREVWGESAFLILMSGSPAPKSPADWWHQCEVACPGFLKEGNKGKFEARLALIVQEEGVAGSFPRRITWLDNPKKCKLCGEFEENHDPSFSEVDHDFEPSEDQVSFLYQRMKGLVTVQFKKDCIDLPEKTYEIIKLEPTQKILRLAKMVQKMSPTTIKALTQLRELSDGFQYQEVKTGNKITCTKCNGNKIIEDFVHVDNPDFNLTEEDIKAGKAIKIELGCDRCGSKGEIPEVVRKPMQVQCPKEDALKDLLEEHEEVGRIVIYAGFTGSVDRCVGICKDAGWNIIRVDGRGWWTDIEIKKPDHLELFQDKLEEYPKIAFIGQPGAAGMGLTLTASPTIVYYSNDFNAESRIQSEDRIHRPGSRGARIIDLVHLHTDELVLENLKKKRKLQSLTLGDVDTCLQNGN